MLWKGFDISHVTYADGEYKTYCPCCREKGEDTSGDNLHVYGEDEDGKPLGFRCFACGFRKSSEVFKESFEAGDFKLLSDREYEKLNEKCLSEKDLEQIFEDTSATLSRSYRGLDANVTSVEGVRWKYDLETGKVSEMWYPAKTMVDGEVKVTGYKVRAVPKSFRAVGYVGKANLLIGQTQAVSEALIVVGGEIDQISATQMLKGLKKYHKTATVVSSIVGEQTTAEALRQNYDWVVKHKRVIFCLDNDVAGREAMKACAEVLPKEILFTANMRHKDPNEYIKNGDQELFAQDVYWGATPLESFGLIGSRSLVAKALEVVSQERIPLPPFLSGLDDLFRGGIGLQEIVNIVSSVSTGKSVFVNEIVLHWIMNSPYKMLIVSLEDNAGSYGAKIASRIIGNKIMAMRTIEERQQALIENQDEINKFLVNEQGEDRFILMEDATSDLESMKRAILQAIKVYGCKICLIDPLASLISSKPLDVQIDWMNWEEEVRRIYGVTFINVAHTKKSTSGEKAHSEGGDISEEHIKGSSQISATATVNIILRRNKVAEDEVERNTTYVDVTKNRTVGITGKNVAKIYYSNEHHVLFNYEYAAQNNFFKGFTPEQIKVLAEQNVASPVTSSVSDIEDVEVDDWDEQPSLSSGYNSKSVVYIEPDLPF